MPEFTPELDSTGGESKKKKEYLLSHLVLNFFYRRHQAKY
jgi:hypothetical protein